MNNMNQGDDEPIDSLADLEQEVSPQFLGAIRKKIYRRDSCQSDDLIFLESPQSNLDGDDYADRPFLLS